MSYYIDRSKGQKHIYEELCRRRDAVGLDGMDMTERIELQCMEIERKNEKKKAESGYYQKYWDERSKTRRLEKELEELKRQQEFDAAVEKAVAERMGTATEPTETTAVKTETAAETTAEE